MCWCWSTRAWSGCVPGPAAGTGWPSWSTPAIAVIANAGSALLETRIPALGEADAVARLLPWRRSIPPVTFHGLSWSRLLHLWREEQRDLDLGGQPVRGFQTYAQRAAR